MKQMDGVRVLVAAVTAIDASQCWCNDMEPKMQKQLTLNVVHMLKTNRSTTIQMPKAEKMMKMMKMMKFLMWNNQTSNSNELK